MAVLKRTPIEMFVNAFVKQNRKFPDKVGKLHLQKAVALIDKKLGYCCDHPEGTLDLVTYKDNLLTNTIKMYLSTMTMAGNEHSLNRTKDKLEQFRLGICAPDGGWCDR